MNNRYAFALALAAGAVLVTGALLRPKPAAPKQPDPAPAQVVVRGTEMRQISDFLSARAQNVARHLAWVASAEATGIQWTNGQMITVGKGASVVRTASVTTQSEPQPVTLAPPSRFDQGGWIVVAARTADGATVTASGLLGGVTPAKCGTEEVRKLVFNIPLDAVYAGAGVFGMSGNLLGMVVKCGDGWIAVAHDSVQALLMQQFGPEAMIWMEVGVRIREPKEAESKILRMPATKGLFIGEVRRASKAAEMGLHPGDLLLIERLEDLLEDREEIPLVRRGRKMTLPVTPPFSLEREGDGAVLSSVQPNTRLGLAGLQPGDRVFDVPALTSSRPVWLVYWRDDREIGVLLP